MHTGEISIFGRDQMGPPTKWPLLLLRRHALHRALPCQAAVRLCILV